jgi:tRNA(Ile)-lysidine synthase
MPGLSETDVDALFAPYGECARVGLAVSGGADSLALMLLAARWAGGRGRGPTLLVYTVDHALRPEAAGEAAMVAREAQSLGLECRILRWEGDKPASGVPAAARAARYRLLGAAAAADGAELVLTAHHLADQAETVLMRLAHGSGVDGLAGMRELSVIEGCRIGRPLLGVHPDRLRAAVAAAGLAPAQDPGNDDPGYERVRWRQFQPRLDAMGLTIERLGVLARRMEAQAALLADAEAEAHARLVEPVSTTQCRILRAPFAALNAAVGAQVLGRVLERVSGDSRAPSLGALESLQARLARLEPMAATTLHGCTIAVRKGAIVIRREGPRRRAGVLTGN